MNEVGRLPQTIDLRLYAGDSALFTFTILDEGEPIDVTVGQWAAQIKVAGATDIAEVFTVDRVTAGVVTLFLDADTSQRLGEFRKQKLRWDLQQTFDDSTVTTHAKGDLLVRPDVTRIAVIDWTYFVTEDGDELVTELGEELVA